MYEFNFDDVAHVWMIHGTVRSSTIRPLVTVPAAEIHVSTCTWTEILWYFNSQVYRSGALVGKATKNYIEVKVCQNFTNLFKALRQTAALLWFVDFGHLFIDISHLHSLYFHSLPAQQFPS